MEPGPSSTSATDPDGRLDAAVRWEDLVLVGRVGRTHGIRGHVFVTPDTDFVESRFATGATLWTQAPGGLETVTVTASRVQNGRPVVAFAGFDSIEAVAPLLGRELRVPEQTLAPLDDGAYYVHDLIGCTVETVGGETIGEVRRVDGGAGASVLSVSGPRGEVLVPLAEEICVAVDIAARRIRIAPPEGLLELNR